MEAAHRTPLSVIPTVMPALAPALRPDGVAVKGLELGPDKAVRVVNDTTVDREGRGLEEAVRVVDDAAVA